MIDEPGKPASDSAELKPGATDFNRIERLREQQRAHVEPGTVLLFGGARYTTSNPLMVRIERYYLSDGHGGPPRADGDPVLTLEYSVLADETVTTQPLIWHETRLHKTWREFTEYRTWLPFAGDLATQQSRALALLEAGADNALSEQLRTLQAEETEPSESTALLGRRDKAFFESELEKSGRLQQEMAVLQHLMQLEIERRMAALNTIKAQATLLVSALQKKIERLVRTITVIELYLGVEEELHQLRAGSSVPADTPISYRQAAMYMDEEVAVRIGFKAARDFDFDHIEAFDEWLLEPGNVDYVLPEKRSIAVFHPRRKPKQYDDSFYVDDRNVKNREYSYFLIRDGENLYRIFTHKLVVGERLFPKRTELQLMFDEFNAARTDRQKETLEDKMYEYRRLSTFLQGLLDRTTVFGPLPSRVNLFNLTEQTQHLIQFIYDADDNLLADGRPAFWVWLQMLNRQIGEGSRVLLTGDYGQYSRRRSDFASRLFYYCNEHSVPPLPSRGIYGVESMKTPATPSTNQATETQQLFILYLPGDTVYGSWGDYDPHSRKKRVGWKIDPLQDRFVLHYDLIRIDDVAYYMRDRVHRKEYSEMLPILESILELKETERRSEQPFVQLVLDEAVRRQISASRETAEAAVVWWKTKNKWKRALTVDDAKALRMILSYLKRLKNNE